MHQIKLSGALVLFVISVGVRSQSGEDSKISNSDGHTSDYIDRPRRSLRARDYNFFGGHRPRFHAYDSRDWNFLKLLRLHRERNSDFMDERPLTRRLSAIPPPRAIAAPCAKASPPIENKPPDVPEVESKCPPGFQYVSLARSCYKVVYEEHNWTSADQRCRGLHPEAHLVAITKEDENMGLTAYLKQELARNSWKYFWTSGRQLNETSCKEPFVWKISNKRQLPLSFTYWYPNEPNCSGNKEPCIHLIRMYNFRWNDAKCSEMIYPLCEYSPS